MAAKFKRSENYNLNKAQLIEKAKTALEACNFEIAGIDEGNGRLQAKAGFSLWSFAENIDVIVEDNGMVTMKSECASSTQIVAWGKNKRNVEKFFDALNAS